TNIASTNGVMNNTAELVWTPSEAEGPGVSNVTVIVFDNGTPRSTNTKSFTITVLETNSAPVLQTLATNVSFTELQSNVVVLKVSDSDVPANTFAFEVLSITDTNSGLMLDPTNITVAVT